ncbi:unnamed protein product [Mytilus edulis]|uniref:B box-type domain-containing protein n=1 Tax=Mytilus edulis TaxID=6550 RepID=A0A8S3RSC9_MYTED|nr:unnamed protein product [Mytilus edulis]
MVTKRKKRHNSECVQYFTRAEHIIQMASSTNILCGICDAQHITKCADHWCPECDEGLCYDCEKHHSISKGTRKHGVIPTEDYKKLPHDILSIGHHCQDHEKKFQNYCPHHEKLCCPTCISTEHRKCVGLLDLDEIVKSSKTSVLIDNLEKTYKDLATNINTIIIDRKGNLAKIKEQRQGIPCRNQTNKITTVRDLQNNIVAMKNHATDLQTFLASKKLEERAMLEEKYLQSILIDSNSLKCLNLKCSISDNIMHIPAIKSFGSISTHVSASSAVLTTEKDKQAQILLLTSMANKSIGDIQETPFVRMAIWFSRIILEGNRLLIMNSMGNLRREISLPSIHPYDVTSLDDNTVAVTTWLQNDIHVIDINTGTIKTCISGDFCGGITHRGNTLICGVRSNELKAVDLRDNEVSALIPEVPINCQTYVTTTSDKIFVTHHANNTVTCYRMNGDKEWQYLDQSMVRAPLGITVDKNNNVYVSSDGNHSVVLITPDGKQARKILEAKDGIPNPYCVHFDQKQNNLLVTCFKGSAFVYNIS